MANRCVTQTLAHASLLMAALLPAAVTVARADAAVEQAAVERLAREILDATAVQGGLIVHMGCGDGRLTAALRASDRYLVQGLDVNAGRVEQARTRIRASGRYGPVSIEHWADASRLPYAENLVNLLVAEQLGTVPREEILRVLAPRGVAYIRDQNGQWTQTVKPWPQEIDEWTHHLHDAGGNAVAQDKVTGPPRQLQWSAAPLWSRSHGWTPSTSAMVSAHGRLFYISDETLTGVDGTVPDKWFLVARDAFSGVLLWKRPIPHWGSEPLSGTSPKGGRFTMPPHAGKRLVAVGDTVYVTLGAAAPVSALDAATGTLRRVFPETANADEILCVEGRLIVALNPSPSGPGDEAIERGAPGKHVCAVDPASGRLLWKKGPFVAVRATRQQDPFGRLELAAGDGQVFLLTQSSLESLDLEGGATRWRIDRPAVPANAVRTMYAGFGVYEYLLTVLVYHEGVLLLSQPEPNVVHTYHTMPGTLYAFDAKTGRQMWSRGDGAWGHDTQPDVFVVHGMVWVHEHAKAEFPEGSRNWSPVNQDEIEYGIQGLDLRTGEVRKRIPTKEIFDVGHHHRCYRNKSTEQFLMCSRRGVEFVDLASGENDLNHWVRSGCLLGNLPCNGLLYVAPHDCGCYIEAKLAGFQALAPARAPAAQAEPSAAGPAGERLWRGPAYPEALRHKGTKALSGGEAVGSFVPQSPIPNPQSPIPNPSDWPTYRHDVRRSGGTDAAIGAKFQPAWEARIGTRPSGVVVADGRLLVAGVDTHTVFALDAQNGKPVWSYTAGARVDSPPTVYQGLAIFGSTDGRVYCLRAVDGALVWRFDAAPRERRVAAFDQLESAWPVPGSVLVHEGQVWCAAGRSSYLDGGIHVYALDPPTGRVVSQNTIYSPDPKTGKMPPGDSQQVAGVLNDIPASDGRSVFIRQLNVSSPDTPEKRHLYSSAGYLDPSWFNRTFWKVGSAATTGLMVLGNDTAFGVEIYPSRSRETVFTPGAKGYRLTCFSLAESAGAPAAKKAKRTAKAPRDSQPIWERQIPIRVSAMVRAGDTLLVAGSPDVVDAQDPHGAWEGRKGGVLAAFSAADGKPLAQCKLDSPPTWDGMAVANGRLYLATLSGRVVALDSKP